MRILIIKTASPEEIILSLPVLDYLHTVFLGIEIDWLVDESCREILEDHPLISRLIISRYAAWHRRPLALKHWREASSLKRIVQERRYDMVFDLEGSLLSGLVSSLSGCRRRYGLDAGLVADQVNLRFTCNRVPMRRQDRHLTDRALRLVSVPFGRDYCDRPVTADMPLQVQPEDEAAAALFMATLSDGLVFLFHLDAAEDTRLWHEAGWIALGRDLLQSFGDATILLSWSGSGGYERIAQGIGRQTRFLPPLSLHGLAAILKKVDLVVGGDCTTLHLAAAMGTPTVSFYRSTDGVVRAPRGELHRFIQSPLKCSRCRQRICDNDQSCRESIQAREIAAAARGILLPSD
jgi:heptosyltransferase-1